MAARARRLTEWYGGEHIASLSAGSGEASFLKSDEVPTPATLIRIIGSVIITGTRAAIIETVSSTSEAGHARVGVMVEETPVTAAAGSYDLSTATVMGDDRWMWVGQCRVDAPAIGYSYWNGSSQVDRYAITPDQRAMQIPIDIRAKRRWVDPCKLSLHWTWTAIGTAFSTMGFRWQLRCLFARH